VPRRNTSDPSRSGHQPDQLPAGLSQKAPRTNESFLFQPTTVQHLLTDPLFQIKLGIQLFCHYRIHCESPQSSKRIAKHNPHHGDQT